MLANQTLGELLAAFSSPDPTPGGGSASALAGALGASLLAMVAGMTKTKSGSAESRAGLDAARIDLLKLRATLVDLIDRDAGAYDAVVAAYRQPKGTDEEKAARKAAIQSATTLATEAPIATMRATVETMRVARVVAEHSNPSAKSDVGTAMHLLMAAQQGAFMNVAINLGSLSDSTVTDRLVAEVKELLEANGRNLGDVFQAAGLMDLMRDGMARGLTPGGWH